jgi:RecB family exonuclease
MTEQPRLKRKAKGERPYFFSDPSIDKLLAMLMGLAGEVSVLRDRLDTVERLAEQNKLFTRAEIENYQPDEEALKERAERRAVFLGEVTRIIEAELEGMQDEDDAPYSQALELVNRTES